MKSLLNSLCLLALLSLASACAEEGQSPDCGAGGRGTLEEDGCLTPIGGSCLTEEEFKADRPNERQDEAGNTITIEEDWEAYQEARPLCF